MPMFLVDSVTEFSVVNEFKQLLELATDALSWIGKNDIMTLVFVCGIAGPIFRIIGKAKRAVR